MNLQQSLRRSGFTLIELVIVIALTGILAATLVIFFRPAVDGYFDARRRASLSDVADAALRLMAREIRAAVPNSIRQPNSQCLELLPTIAGGRYRMAPDTARDATCTGTACSKSLDTAQPSDGFDVFSPFSTAPAADDWVVIANHNSNDVYQGSNRAAITQVVPLTASTTPTNALGAYRITFPATQFPAGYDGGRFSIVANNGGAPAVVYLCDQPGLSGGNGTGTLYRLTRSFDAAYPTACPAATGAAVVATHVSQCRFTYSPTASVTQQNSFVTMLLEITRSSETVSLSLGTHVDNVP